jgi:diguanylate cyclase (GGDEF)-like protein
MTSQASAAATQAGLLGLVVHPDGSVRSVVGRWAGVGRPAVANLADFIHPDDHDAVAHALQWTVAHRSVTHAIPVDVRGPGGWAPALASFETDTDGIRCTFTPVIADPLTAVTADIIDQRRPDDIVRRATDTFAATTPAVGVSVHHRPDSHGRRRSVVTSIPHEGFANAVAHAAAGDIVNPWDVPIAEEPRSIAIETLTDGLRMAASHAGVKAAVAVPIPAIVGDDAAVLMVWTDNGERLADPAVVVALDRLTDALSLAFCFESMRSTVRHVATHDDLTGLWNRQALHAELDRLGPTSRAAVAWLDIDDFDSINSRFGHTAGDDMLIDLARRLRDVVRPGDFLARWSGDDMVIVCHELTSESQVEAIAQRILSATYQPFHLAGVAVEIRANLGVAMTDGQSSGRQLLDAAGRTVAHLRQNAPGTWQRSDMLLS